VVDGVVVTKEEQIATLPTELKIETQKENIVDFVTMGSTTVYAYKTVNVPKQKDEILEKRTGSSRTFTKNGKNVTEFYSGEQFYKETTGEWKQLEYGTTTPKAFILQTRGFFREVYADSGTFYSSSYDGAVWHGDAVWANVRSAATSLYSEFGNATISLYYTATGYYLQRVFITFNVGATIPAGSTIDSAVLSLASTGSDRISDPDSDSVGIIESTQAAEILAKADYDQCYPLNSPTELATRIAASAWSTTDGTYMDFTLNASGKAIIATAAGQAAFAGFAKFCTRSGRDIDNSAPTVGTNTVGAYMSEYTGTTRDPKLVVTWSAGGGGVAPIINQPILELI
jgi:hypothetical protein